MSGKPTSSPRRKVRTYTMSSEPGPVKVTQTFPKVNLRYAIQNLQKSQKNRERGNPSTMTLHGSDSETLIPPASSWFDRLDVPENPPPDCSLSHIIDVQPDFRYPLSYITYSVKELYANAIVSEVETRVSMFTFIYYCQSLVVASLLFYDMYARPQKSAYAASFLQDARRNDFSETLFSLRVPNFMAQILLHLCPAYDAQHPGLLYVPTLAGFSWEHDFGRIVPPGIFLAANSVICKNREESNPMEILRRFHSTKIVSVAGKDYFTTNFLGGPYLDGEEVCDRANWIREDLEYFVSSGMGGAYEYECHFFPLKFDHERNINPYDLMLCHDEANLSSLVKILKSVSRFFQDKEPSAQALADLLSAPSAITVMSHFYSSPTLPTCHSLPPPPVVYESEHNFVDDAQFAVKVRFLSNPDGDSRTSHVQFSPLGFERFDRFTNVRGDIFGFQPYGLHASTLRIAITLGLTIENGDIDGVTISQPNLRLALCENHSHLLQGSLPARIVHSYIPNFHPDNKLVIFRRADHLHNNPVGFARADMGRIIQKNVEFRDVSLPVNTDICYTYMAWNRADEVLPIPDSSVYCWSSYRYVHKAGDREAREVFFYHTMKSFYGNAVTMTKLKCPAWLFPS